MAEDVSPLFVSLDSVPLSALNIGVWEDAPKANRVRGDAVMAHMFGLSEAEATEGITWERLSQIFHPDDLALDTVERRRVREDGGLFDWTHRIIPQPGLVRWVLARGYFRHETDGSLCGRGIVIDITGLQSDGLLEGSTRFESARDGAGSPLQAAADHTIMLARAVEGLDPTQAARIEPFLKPLLYEIGRQIAAVIANDSGGSRDSVLRAG